MATSKDLVKLVDDGDNSPVSFEKMGELKSVLNQNPNRNWVKNHPFANGVVYLPIDKVETMLDMIFQQWKVEVLSISQLAQSICCVIRLHYLNPVTKEWSYHDGVGAVPLKTDKGFSAADLSHIKSDAVTTGAPAAKSFAIKDAAEHLGKLFGRDLNRKDAVAYTNLYSADTNWKDELISCKTLDDLRKVWNKIPKEQQYDEELINTKEEMKNMLG
jgi:hypothetical protein